MAYINTKTNQYPVSEQDIRNEYPNTSFPVPFQAPEDYSPVMLSPTPEYNQILQFVREGQPELVTKNESSFYMQTWEVVDLFQEYTDVDGNTVTKEEQEAAAIKADEDTKKLSTKRQAEQLLKETDWVEVPSVSDTTRIPHLANYEEFMTYRMGVRAIAVSPTAYQNFPVLPKEVWVTE